MKPVSWANSSYDVALLLEQTSGASCRARSPAERYSRCALWLKKPTKCFWLELFGRRRLRGNNSYRPNLQGRLEIGKVICIPKKPEKVTSPSPHHHHHHHITTSPHHHMKNLLPLSTPYACGTPQQHPEVHRRGRTRQRTKPRYLPVEGIEAFVHLGASTPTAPCSTGRASNAFRCTFRLLRHYTGSFQPKGRVSSGWQMQVERDAPTRQNRRRMHIAQRFGGERQF